MWQSIFSHFPSSFHFFSFMLQYEKRARQNQYFFKIDHFKNIPLTRRERKSQNYKQNEQNHPNTKNSNLTSRIPKHPLHLNRIKKRPIFFCWCEWDLTNLKLLSISVRINVSCSFLKNFIILGSRVIPFHHYLTSLFPWKNQTSKSGIISPVSTPAVW
jgi:hypothetical protein